MKNWFKNIKAKRSLLMIPVIFLFLVTMGFVNNEQKNKNCKNIYVHIDFEHDNYFVTKEDVLNLVTLNNDDILIGKRVDNINLKELELRVKSHNFVEDAQVFKDHKGNLTVKVSQCRPIARIIDHHGPHAYIGSNGKSLPSSDRFTARVLLIDGPYSKKLKDPDFLNSEEGKPYFDLIRFIDENKFWKAQLSQMTILKDGEIKFYPQIGDQVVEFGKPENLDGKFKKLKIFYKKIYPFKGYNEYDRISLEFENQIVCE